MILDDNAKKIIFDDNIKKMLLYARQLFLIGETELATAICINCVRKVAYADSVVDVLELFYGEAIYREIVDCDSAMKYIFLASLCQDVYGLMSAGNDVKNSVPIREVFDWLSQPNRVYRDGDNAKLRILLRSLQDKDQTGFKIKNAQVNLVTYIRSIVR